MRNYHVVFEYTEATGGYKGVRTWTSFKDKAEFDKWYTQDIKDREALVKEGVSQSEALRLCRQTPIKSDVASCFQAATMQDGTVNHDILEMQLANVIFARKFGNRGRPLSDTD